MIIRNKTGKIIGVYSEIENTFEKRVKKSKHLFRKLNAWGIDGEVFSSLLLPRKSLIRIVEEEEKTTYEIGAGEFEKNGAWFHFKGGDDHLAQIFLPLVWWKVT